MLYINTTKPVPGRVNPSQLAEVRTHHMPATTVRFAPSAELQRVAYELACERPELVEEATFVVHEELGRRNRLAQVSMEAVKGGQRHA